MGGIYEVGFEKAVQNGGLSSLGDYKVGLTLDGSPDFEYDFQDSDGNNPLQLPQTDWSRTNERLMGDGHTWGTWTSNLDGQTLGSLDLKVDLGSAAPNFGSIDGGDFPQTVNLGTDVEVNVGASAGTFNFVRPGLAEIVLNGISSITAYYVLLDNGSPIGGGATINSGGSAPAWTYEAGNNDFTAGGDATFNNSSGSSWNVTAIEVRVGSETGATIFNDSVSATVADGGSITFTDITQSIGGLS